MNRRTTRWRRAAFLRVCAAFLTLAVAPAALAADSFEGEALAADVADSIDSDAQRPRGEWGLVTDQMTILGLGQVVLAHSELRDRYVPIMEKAAEHMTRPSQRAFATARWGSDGFEHLDDDRGEAWLGWPDVALSMLRLVHPSTPFANLNDRITDALERRLSRAPHALIETYPGESFPTDVAVCAAAISLRDRATGSRASTRMRSWASTFRAAWLDPASGYLWQKGDARTGSHRGAPRGSGTAVTAYVLSFVDPALSRDLTDALERHRISVLGYSAVQEYAEGYQGEADVDSGPIVMGTSVAATGFAIGAARANGQSDLAEHLLRTARAFGRPIRTSKGVRFAVGGAMGNAIMLAQMTASPSGR